LRFYFGKFDPKDYDAKEIHQTFNRPYGRHLYKNFNSNIVTLAKRVINFKEFGTGLLGKYRTKLYLDEPIDEVKRGTNTHR
jgi:hypothetical protein